MGVADFVNLDKVPTVAQQSIERAGKPLEKGASRSEVKAKDDAADERNLEAWRTAVYSRDEYICRCCKKKVHRTLEMVPDQANAHHIVGRAVKITRYDVRNGATLCRKCHERVTGAVNDKLVILGTKVFVIGARKFIDATARLIFKKAAA